MLHTITDYLKDLHIDKIFNNTSLVIGTIGGFLAKQLGGWDLLVQGLVTVIVLDYISGLVKAVYNKEISSSIGFKGISKKVMILICVAVAQIVQQFIGDSLPIREIVIIFFIANEGISILENASKTGVFIPTKLKDLLLQLREKGESKNGEDDKVA